MLVKQQWIKIIAFTSCCMMLCQLLSIMVIAFMTGSASAEQHMQYVSVLGYSGVFHSLLSAGLSSEVHVWRMPVYITTILFTVISGSFCIHIKYEFKTRM